MQMQDKTRCKHQMLRRAIKAIIAESEKHSKDIIALNIRALKKSGFQGSHSELQAAAQSGPIFDKTILSVIKNIPRGPTRNEKPFMRWLANSMKGITRHDDIPEIRDLDLIAVETDVSEVIDWLNGDTEASVEGLTWRQALHRARAWHRSLEADDNVEIVAKEADVVKRWPDGWTIVRVPAGACDTEGKAMGHCVAGYASRVESGNTNIFSLRDPRGRPHVTIEVEPAFGEVVQIKGKQNLPPQKRMYAEKVKEWLGSTSYDPSETNDYWSLLDIDDVRDAIEQGSNVKLQMLRGDVASMLTEDDLLDIEHGEPGMIADLLGLDWHIADAGEPKPGTATHIIMQMMLGSSNAELRRAIVPLITSSPDAIKLLMVDPDTGVRRLVARELSLWLTSFHEKNDFTDRMIKQLKSMADDEDRIVRFYTKGQRALLAAESAKAERPIGVLKFHKDAGVPSADISLRSAEKRNPSYIPYIFLNYGPAVSRRPGNRIDEFPKELPIVAMTRARARCRCHLRLIQGPAAEVQQRIR